MAGVGTGVGVGGERETLDAGLGDAILEAEVLVAGEGSGQDFAELVVQEGETAGGETVHDVEGGGGEVGGLVGGEMEDEVEVFGVLEGRLPVIWIAVVEVADDGFAGGHAGLELGGEVGCAGGLEGFEAGEGEGDVEPGGFWHVDFALVFAAGGAEVVVEGGDVGGF